MRLFLLPVLLFALSTQAAPLKKFDLSAAEERAIQEHHQSLNQMMAPMLKLPAPLRPVSEVEEAGYLFFSASTSFDSELAKETMARHLPAGVTLVVYTDEYEDHDEIRERFDGVIDPTRLKVVEIPGARRGFWARDGLPVPVWSSEKTLELVDARYYHSFEPDDVVGEWFKAPMHKHNYYFEGGNFMVNDEGICVTVDNTRSIGIPDSVFTNHYGCKNLIRLPFEKGIGHVDESVRFLTSKIVLTDSATYAERFRKEGLDVRLLPRPQRAFETYVNALLVNGTVFVPVYGEAKDEEALKVYRDAGVQVVPIESVELSNEGKGSIHCITMTYPKVPFQQLMGILGGRER